MLFRSFADALEKYHRCYGGAGRAYVGECVCLFVAFATYVLQLATVEVSFECVVEVAVRDHVVV